MKGIILWILSTLLAFGTINVQNAYGQEDELDSGKIGVGIALFNIMDFILLFDEVTYTNSIYFPLNISDRFRIEPEIGILSSGTDVLYSIGIGAFGLIKTPDITWYYGARVSTWDTHYFTIAPSLGGEYFLSRRFSLGAEAQILGIIENGDFMFMTNTYAFLRFYIL